MNEAARHITRLLPYLQGNGVDIGSGGWPIVPWAIQMEQSPDDFRRYNQREIPKEIQWKGVDIFHLPIMDGTLDFVFSSHLIEDFSREDWKRMFSDWWRVLKCGGHMVLLVPDYERWNAQLKAGRTPNCAHFAPEPVQGEMTRYTQPLFLKVMDELADPIDREDINIIGVFRKP